MKYLYFICGRVVKQMLKNGIVVVLLLLTACQKHSLPPEEVWIKNGQNEPLYLYVDGLVHAGDGKFAIIQHGLASSMEHPVVQTARKAFTDNGYVVVVFDSRHSLGKSGGDVADVRLASFEDDLKAVVDWAKSQEFYSEPFALAGHSLGGASVLKYAAEYPEQVSRLVPVTPVVSGQKWEKGCMDNMPDFCRKWKKEGFYNYQTAVIPYAVVEEAKVYDALKLSDKIKADVLLVTAEEDRVIPSRDVKELYDALPGKKRFEIIPASGHNFESRQSQEDLYGVLAGFLQ